MLPKNISFTMSVFFLLCEFFFSQNLIVVLIVENAFYFKRSLESGCKWISDGISRELASWLSKNRRCSIDGKKNRLCKIDGKKYRLCKIDGLKKSTSVVLIVTSITIEVRQINWNTLFCILNFVDSYLSYGNRLLFSLILLISFIRCYFKIYKESIHTYAYETYTYSHSDIHSHIHTKKMKGKQTQAVFYSCPDISFISFQSSK